MGMCNARKDRTGVGVGWARGTTAGRGSSALTGGDGDRSPAWVLRSTSGAGVPDEGPARRRAGGRASRRGGRDGHSGIGRLAVGRRQRSAGGLLGGDGEDPAGHAGALRAGGRHLPGVALDDPGCHRHRRVGQRPVEPPGCPQRRQFGRRRRTDAVRTDDVRATTTSRCLRVGRAPPSPTTRRTPSTPRPGCCAPTAAAGGADLSGAVYDYNHSASYVAEVLALAQTYAGVFRRHGCRHGVE